MGRIAFKTPANYVPLAGNRELQMVYDFTAVQSIDDDLSNEQRNNEIDIIQSVFIDNFDNAQNFILQFMFGLQQRIVCPPLSQGIFPVLAPGAVKVTARSTGGVKVPVIFSNVRREFKVWGPVTVNVGVINVSQNPLQANVTQTKIVMTGANQVALAANANRRRLVLNPAAANIGPIAYNYTAAAVMADNAQLLPGQPFDSATGPVSAQAVNVIGTAGDILIVSES